MEEEHTTNKGLYDSNQLHEDDCQRVTSVLDKIVFEGRLAVVAEGDDKVFVKK